MSMWKKNDSFRPYAGENKMNIYSADITPDELKRVRPAPRLTQHTNNKTEQGEKKMSVWKKNDSFQGYADEDRLNVYSSDITPNELKRIRPAPFLAQCYAIGASNQIQRYITMQAEAILLDDARSAGNLKTSPVAQLEPASKLKKGGAYRKMYEVLIKIYKSEELIPDSSRWLVKGYRDSLQKDL